MVKRDGIGNFMQALESCHSLALLSGCEGSLFGPRRHSPHKPMGYEAMGGRTGYCE